jgi:hypothetical protein
MSTTAERAFNFDAFASMPATKAGLRISVLLRRYRARHCDNSPLKNIVRRPSGSWTGAITALPKCAQQSVRNPIQRGLTNFLMVKTKIYSLDEIVEICRTFKRFCRILIKMLRLDRGFMRRLRHGGSCQDGDGRIVENALPQLFFIADPKAVACFTCISISSRMISFI